MGEKDFFWGVQGTKEENGKGDSDEVEVRQKDI